MAPVTNMTVPRSSVTSTALRPSRRGKRQRRVGAERRRRRARPTSRSRAPPLGRADEGSASDESEPSGGDDERGGHHGHEGFNSLNEPPVEFTGSSVGRPVP